MGEVCYRGGGRRQEILRSRWVEEISRGKLTGHGWISMDLHFSAALWTLMNGFWGVESYTTSSELETQLCFAHPSTLGIQRDILEIIELENKDI